MPLHVIFHRNATEIRSWHLWKSGLAEFLGTLILVFVGCSVCLDNWQKKDDPTVNSGESTIVQIALTFGLAVAIAGWSIGHISGGHINPAVTIPMLLMRKIGIARACVYVVAQLCGAVAGAAILHGKRPLHA